MASKIAWARQYLGLSASIVSQLTGIEIGRLGDIEAGANVANEELDLLSGLYKFSPEYLLGHETDEHGKKTMVLPRAAAELSERDDQELEWFSQFLVAAGRRSS